VETQHTYFFLTNALVKQPFTTMSSITVPKTKARGCAAASSRVESAVMPILPAVTPVQRRTAKKARSTLHLVESVQEVVQAFEFDYAQVRRGSGDGCSEAESP